jgi:hypothetical protein
MNVRVTRTSFRTNTVQTRLPFKFGVQVLQSVQLAELSLEVEGPDGRRSMGRAGDLLVPKWFEKNPDRTSEEDAAALAESVEAAASIATLLGSSAGPHPVFELWSVIHAEQVGACDHRNSDALVRGFGVAMVERALIDATTRLAGCSFNHALRSGMLGFNPRRLVGEASGWTPDRLPDPARSIEVRHTVGMLDPLTIGEIPAGERVHDGLPQSLDEDIDAYGVRCFKIKVCGDPEIDRERLRDVARVTAAHVGPDARFTLDGNEQCHDLDGFAGMLETLAGDREAGPLVERLELIEQPLPRRETFEPEANTALDRLSRIAPVIIDEADTDGDAFRRAIELGYAGTSIKACKGVFRAVANRALIDVRRDAGATHLFQSAEDLTNLGSIPLQQDLALQATLGMDNVERNGHHYFRGLDHLPEATRSELVDALPGLYIQEGALVRVRIKSGRLDLDGVIDGTGLGGHLGSMLETGQQA